MTTGSTPEHLLRRVADLLDRVATLLPPAAVDPDWSHYAFRWRRGRQGGGWLQTVTHPHAIQLADLRGIDRQKTALVRNTRQFIEGFPANNALLWGSRGTGKSSLIKALVNAYAAAGLRIVEVDRNDLIDLPDVLDRVAHRRERFVLFSDDLSFEAGDPSYKALKAALDGSVYAPPDNVLIYATSNRRHLMPEYMSENLEARAVEGEIHHGESVEEKISLSERFGLWLSFHPFNQDQYLDIVDYWLARLDSPPGATERRRAEALRWALTRGSRSGRSAYQFARDWAGRTRLAGKKGSDSI